MQKKKIALICPVFYPENNSAAIQLKDLFDEFRKQNYFVNIFVKSSDIKTSYSIEHLKNGNIVRFSMPKINHNSYIRRTLIEFLTPYIIMFKLRKLKLYLVSYDAIIWYSPSFFLYPLVKFFKNNNNNCPSYLILRDIFPEWALNVGIIKKNLIYYFFKYIEYKQYHVSDYVGIQTKSSLSYFSKLNLTFNFEIHVLNNWLTDNNINKCSLHFKNTILFNKKIFVYAGNMGIAQELDVFLKLAKKLANNPEIGFLFIGKGSEKKSLEKLSSNLNLKNVLFLDEIKSIEINGLLKKCFAGIISLHSKHKTSNIPGKFLSYIMNGLPVMAVVNKGNDLIDIIESNNIGVATHSRSIEDLQLLVEKLLVKSLKVKYEKNSKNLFNKFFVSSIAVKEITKKIFI